jgi:PAS domain S-box-containing protein
MRNNNENKFINIIRYGPPIFIIIVALCTYLFVSYEHHKNLEDEKNRIKSEYLQDEKKRIQSLIDNTTYTYINNAQTVTKERLKQKIKRQIYNAHDIATNIYSKYKDTKTKEEISMLIKHALEKIRFLNGRGYFFIYTLKGRSILNAGFPQLEGRDLWNYKDAKGTLLTQEMHKILQRKNETFFDWYWHKPNDKVTQYKKVGFFKKFEPYDWFIGTGEYLDDFTKEVQQNTISHIKELRYKNNGYIFIIDGNGVILTTQNKQFDNVNLLKDSRFKSLTKEFQRFRQKIHNEKGMFIQYDKINLTKEKKVSYIKYFSKWNWIIGTGFNIDDVNSIIDKRQSDIEKKYKHYLNKLLMISFILLIVLLLISYLLSKYLQKIFNIHTKDLEAQRNKLLEAQNVAQIGEWELDIKTMKAYWSNNVIKMLGLKEGQESCCGPELIKELMNEEDWPKFEASITNTIQNGTDHHVTYRVTKENNSEIWIECRGKLNQDEGKIVGTVQDITELKHKDKLLADQSKLASMGEMIGNIAHQWRQPLSIISTCASGLTIKKEHNILDDEYFYKTCKQIDQNAQYLSRTIDDFRNFIKGDTKAVEFNLKDNINSFLQLVSVVKKNNSIDIQLDIENNIILTGYPNELLQCFMNIFNNSKDAFLENEKLENRLFFIDVKKWENKVEIVLKDNAGGIENNIISKVFDPYFTTKHKSKGTGIGLNMTYNLIVNGMNGTIAVRNSSYKHNQIEYRGAQFIITIPLNS